MEKLPLNQRRRKRVNEFNNQASKKNKKYVDTYYIIKYFVLWCVFALLCYGMKMVVMSSIALSPTHEVGNGLLRLYEVHNTGAAFNLFSGHPEALITMSVLAVAAITIIVLSCSTKLTQAAISAMAFLSAGISMNLFERINYGYVIDYINCAFLPNFPVFNVPDIMIVVGTVCLILSVLIQRR